MTRKSWLIPPGEAASTRRPGRVKATTLSDLAAGPSKRKGRQCRICLEPGVKLAGGVCEDRAACEERQPPLIPMGEFTDDDD